MKVHEALSAVMADVQAVGKGDVNKQQGFRFRGIDAVLNAVGPVLRKHQVVVLPRVLDKQYGTFQSKGGGLMHEAIIEVEYTFVGPEGDVLVCSAVGESADAGDKATPKAMSVAFRSALIQALCLPTDQPDPDESVYERSGPVSRPPKAAKYAKQDIVWHIKKEWPGIDDDEVTAVAMEVWEWGGIADDADVTPEVLDDLLGRIGVVVTARIRAEAEAPNQ